jgi:SpoVK/Ycf46/Vps4 family AAA+-type ATPase
LQKAAKLVQPSSKREGFSTIPNVKWEDVGGLDDIRDEFDLYIISRIKYPDDYQVTVTLSLHPSLPFLFCFSFKVEPIYMF